MIPKVISGNFRFAYLPAVLIALSAVGRILAAAPGQQDTQTKAVQMLRGLRMSFEPNVGQADSSVDYVARGAGYSVSLTTTGAALQLSRAAAPGSLAEALQSPAADLSRDLALPSRADATWNPLASHARETESETVMLRLLGASRSARAVAQQRLPGRVNYLLGNDRARWRRNVPTYSQVRYKDVYKKIDVIYYGAPSNLEFDFAVRPGGDPTAIRLDFPGSARLRLNERGDLLISKGERFATTLHAPRTYQVAGAVHSNVDSRFVIHDDNTVGFSLGAYDPAATLVIDPVMTYSTFLGGASSDVVMGVAVDGSSNTYVTGYTTSANFPTATPLNGTRSGASSDIFVSKINPAGTALVYSTYLGGTGFDHGHAIAVEASGAVTITGDTSSANFPLQNPLQPVYGGGAADLFITRLNPAGSALTYSTYLGGSATDANGSDEAFSHMLSVDAAGNALVIGATSSVNFPTVTPLQVAFGGQADVVIAKVNATGSALVFSTFLGGSSVDVGTSIAASAAGDIFITGGTNSTNFPVQAALDSTHGGGTCGTSLCPDAFVARLNATGSRLAYSTYLGGAGAEEAEGIAVDGAGSAYVTGFTTSSDFPLLNPIQATKAANADVFVTKLNPTGSALAYSTYLGGGGDDVALGVALDNLNRVYLTGYTLSNAFPIAGATQSSRTGVANAFLTVVNAAGSGLDFSTYLGGNTLEFGTSVAVDSARSSYVAGLTLSTNFPTVSPLQGAYGGGTCGTAPDTFPCEDGFLTKFSAAAVPPSVTSLSPSSATAGGAAFTLSVNGTGFTANAIVRVGALTRPTTFVSSTLLTAAMNASDIAQPGTLQISVFSGAPDNVSSNALTFTITAGANAPAVAQGGVVNNASFAPSPAPVAPGSIAAIFGERLTDGSTALSSSFDPSGRLVTTLAGARVTVNGTAAPIFYATPGQLGIQIPVEVSGQSTASLQVNVGGALSTPVTINLAPAAPGIFTANQSGSGPGAITHADGSLVTEGNPARPGEIVIIYVTGLGALVPAVGTGVRAGASASLTPAVVSFNGVAGAVDYSGAAPGFVGLNQINVRVPEGVLPSNNVQVAVRIGGRDSNTASIAVQ